MTLLPLRAPRAALLLALLVPTSAIAESSVSLFGTLDVGMAYLHGSNQSGFGLSTSGANVSRIGLRGQEDLGDGLSAGFWLESGLDVDTGTGKAPNGALFFNRRSTVSLMGRAGELRIGRDDPTTFLNTLIFDPFLTNGVGGTMMFYMLPGPPNIQIANAISYLTPTFKGPLAGAFAQLQFAPGEQDSPTRSAGATRGIRVGYRGSALHVAAAYSRQFATSTVADARYGNIAAWYDFGVIRPMVLLATAARGPVRINAAQIGFTAPAGSGTIKAAYGRYNTVGSSADWSKISLGYGYDLSRRSQIYGSVGHILNRGSSQRAIGVQGLTAPTTEAGSGASGIELGFRHFF